MPAHHDPVPDFLAAYGRSLAGGDLDGIAACYAYPALVVGDEGSVPVPDAASVVEAFRGAADQHRSQGLVEAVPEVVADRALTGALRSVLVRWSYRDERGTEQQSDGWEYVLRVGDEVAICALAVAEPERLAAAG